MPQLNVLPSEWTYGFYGGTPIPILQTPIPQNLRFRQVWVVFFGNFFYKRLDLVFFQSYTPLVSRTSWFTQYEGVNELARIQYWQNHPTSTVSVNGGFQQNMNSPGGYVGVLMPPCAAYSLFSGFAGAPSGGKCVEVNTDGGYLELQVLPGDDSTPFARTIGGIMSCISSKFPVEMYYAQEFANNPI